MARPAFVPPPSEPELDVLVVGDDPLARDRVAALIAERAGLRVIGRVGTGEEALPEVSASTRLTVLWDLGLDVRTGLERFRERADAEFPIVVLVADSERTRDALAAGARGVLLRDVDSDRVEIALRAVAAGLVVLDGGLEAALQRPESRAAADLVEPLTAREREVLALLAEGLPNKIIAARLGISDHTAKFHVNAILGKLGAESRTEAVMRAVRLGWIAL
jgi:DNA-binding NarL/FixJ family response regulator